MEEQDLKKLSPDQLEQLKKQIEALQTRQGQAAAPVRIERGVKVKGGDLVGRDKITIQYGVYQGEAPTKPEEAKAIYLAVIADQCGAIPLSGLEREADDAGSHYRPLGLERVYVDLDTQAQVSDKIVKKALAARRATTPALRATPPLQGGELLTKDLLLRENRADDPRPLSALEAAALYPRLALIGEPGSGKTTFVNRLCLALARGEWNELERWPKRERGRLPVLIVLRDFARWLANRAEPAAACAALLWEFIEHDLQRRKLGFAVKIVEQALDQNAQVFLDGLDEVPPALRAIVLATIDQFAGRYGNAWLLVTCRVASYQQADWRLPEDRFPKLELAPFDPDKIQRFITAWYDEMAERWNEPPERTRELAAKLNEQALRRSDLARLAPNPLLLTVMALVHTHDKVLPDHRAVLYERIVELLLWR